MTNLTSFNFDTILQLLVAFVGAYLVAFWFSLVVWTFRDIRARTRDLLLQFLAVLLVLLFSLPGLVLYFVLRPRETLSEAYERSLEEETLLQEIEEQQVCPGCKRRIEADFVVCPTCRTELRRQCNHCKRTLHLSWGVCPYCAGEVTGVRAVKTA
ncbi:MAG: zinc ribbon domain-containing protein [Chloroflexi bacterium]|nr:zinc ribbon domain-containing protein [Chloroflexota bacterium]